MKNHDIFPSSIDNPTITERTLGPSFTQRFSDARITSLITNLRKTGAPVYRPKDIASTIHPLARLLRMMFVDRRITHDYLDDAYRRYCNSLGFDIDAINAGRGNIIKALRKDDITFLCYEKIHSILGSSIVDMEVSLLLNTNRVVSYRYNDIHRWSECSLKEGTPIFTPEDILSTKHPIARFIRMYIIDQGICMEEFRTRHYEYYFTKHYSPNWISSNRNNSIRRYFKDSPMFSAWELFNTVMGITIVDLSTTTRHDDGMVVHYALSDVDRYSRMPDPWANADDD